MARILLYSRDPGGANVIVPLVRPLRSRGHEVVLLGRDMALTRYVRAGLEAVDIRERAGEVTQESIVDLLTSMRPGLVATATSADDFTERFLWRAAGIRGIPSMAILDQWLNYGIRFSDYPLSQIDRYLRTRSHVYLPSKILVMDETARTEAAADGLDARRLVVTGHPHLETVVAAAQSISTSDVLSLRAAFGLHPSDRLVTFASEPISEAYGGAKAGLEFWGYNEQTVFAELLAAVTDIAEGRGIRVCLVVRPHPRESGRAFDEAASRRPAGSVFLRVDREADAFRLIRASDVVCGMSSMFLIEAAAAGAPVISLQIGLRRDNPFVLDRLGVIRSTLEASTLRSELERFVVRSERPRYRLDCSRNAVEKIVKEMEESLCPSSR